MKRCGIIVALAVLVGCGLSPAPTRTQVARLEAPGAFFLVGGGDLPSAMLGRFLARSGGAKAPIVVVPFASGEAQGEQTRRSFAELGADVRVLTGVPAHQAEEEAAIRQANGLFFVGGLPEKLTSQFQPYMAAVQAAWEKGCVVGGTSAGAMVWGGRMIVRGEAGPVRQYGLDEGRGGMAIRPGFGLLSGVMVDPHFSERERFYRLWLAAGETGALGLGVDEGTAAVVTSVGKLEAQGVGTVTVLRPEGGPGQPARVMVLAAGETLDLREWGLPGARTGE